MGLQRCFFWHLDIRILNAYLLYQKKIKSKLSLLQYRTIIMKYLSQVGTEEQPGNSDSSSVRLLNKIQPSKLFLSIIVYINYYEWVRGAFVFYASRRNLQ